MAYTEIELTAAGTSSSLGDYTFNCIFDDSPTLGTYARASMTKDGQTVYKTVSLPNSSQIQGYSIEANETEATVYAVVKTTPDSPIPEDVPYVSISAPYATGNYQNPTSAWLIGGEDESKVYVFETNNSPVRVAIVNDVYVAAIMDDSNNSFWVSWKGKTGGGSGVGSGGNRYTYNNKTVIYGTLNYPRINQAENNRGIIPIVTLQGSYNVSEIAWAIAYGSSEEKTEEILVGRFAIDLGDAGGYPGGGGVGGGDWDEPGDWNEDPTTTLHVEVDGALSGRHNDPLHDTSYSYAPTDKVTVKQYGCGGDGGHGGGGGAGASAVVVHKLATNKANSHEVTAIAKRHGYGSGGGKGGKGGDGCILVYY